jgi:hypothetical protein
MSMDVEIYAAVLQRVAEADHDWGKPYDFPAWYVLDHVVPAVENPRADLDAPAPGHPFDEALRAALRVKLAALPALTFMHSFHEVYDAQRTGPIQIRNGGRLLPSARSTETFTPPSLASCSMAATAGYAG